MFSVWIKKLEGKIIEASKYKILFSSKKYFIPRPPFKASRLQDKPQILQEERCNSQNRKPFNFGAVEKQFSYTISTLQIPVIRDKKIEIKNTSCFLTCSRAAPAA
jgi:hypothetical protein